MRNRPRRSIVVVLAAEEWDRLVDQSRASDRDPIAQARRLIVRGLETSGDVEAPAGREAPTEAVA